MQRIPDKCFSCLGYIGIKRLRYVVIFENCLSAVPQTMVKINRKHRKMPEFFQIVQNSINFIEIPKKKEKNCY